MYLDFRNSIVSIFLVAVLVSTCAGNNDEVTTEEMQNLKEMNDLLDALKIELESDDVLKNSMKGLLNLAAHDNQIEEADQNHDSKHDNILEHIKDHKNRLENKISAEDHKTSYNFEQELNFLRFMKNLKDVKDWERVEHNKLYSGEKSNDLGSEVEGRFNIY